MIYSNSLWLNDIDRAMAIVPELDVLTGKTILITGGTGLVCSPIVDILIRYNETHKKPINIVVAGRSENNYITRFYPYHDSAYIHFVKFDASTGNNDFNYPYDYIIHGASNSSPKMILNEPVETILDNIIGLKTLLDYAYNNNTLRVLYISSSEVYGQNNRPPFREDDYGYIDPLNPRNSYSFGKCAAESLCVSYGKEYGVDSVIVRPGHIYGPTASSNDSHVASTWCYSAVHGDDIIMKSKGNSLRSYCYCLDCATGIIKALIKGECLNAYNISNKNSIMSINEMAKLISNLTDIRVVYDLPSDSEKSNYNPMINSCLNSEKLEALGWQAIFDADLGFNHTLIILNRRVSENKGLLDLD